MPADARPVFRCTLVAGDRTAAVAIHGSTVTVDDTIRDFGSVWLAVAVFEANVASLERASFEAVSAPVGSPAEIDLPSVRSSVESGRLVVELREVDSIAYEDGLIPRLRKVAAFAGFDPETPPPNGVMARHVLRRLAGLGPAELALQLCLAERFVDPVLADVARFGLGPTVSRLELGELLREGVEAPLLTSTPLAERLPALTGLTLPWWAWSLVQGGVFHELAELTLDRSYPQPVRARDSLAQVVTLVARACPALRVLVFQCTIDERAVKALTRYRLPERLAHLDLRRSFATTERDVYEALLASGSTLRDIGRITVKAPHRASLRAKLAAWDSIDFGE